MDDAHENQNSSRKSTLQEDFVCLDLNAYELIDRKEALMVAERLLIKELGFQMQQLTTTTVHKHLVQLLSQVSDTSLIQLCWTIANDSYLYPLVICY